MFQRSETVEGLRPFAVKTKTSAEHDRVVAALRPAPLVFCDLDGLTPLIAAGLVGLQVQTVFQAKKVWGCFWGYRIKFALHSALSRAQIGTHRGGELRGEVFRLYQPDVRTIETQLPNKVRLPRKSLAHYLHIRSFCARNTNYIN